MIYPFIGPTRTIHIQQFSSRKNESMYLSHPIDAVQCEKRGSHHINECGYRFEGTVPHEIRDKAPATFRDLDRLTQRVVALEVKEGETTSRINHLERAIIHLERVNSAMKRIFKGGK